MGRVIILGALAVLMTLTPEQRRELTSLRAASSALCMSGPFGR
jgi:hypothetical protein